MEKRYANKIETQVKRLASSYDNPIQKVVEKEVLTIVRDIICNEYQTKLGGLVCAALTDEVVAKVVDKVWKVYFDRM